MSVASATQLDLIIKLARGKVVPHSMLSRQHQTRMSRLLQLTASVAGHLCSLNSSRMVITGKHLAWSSGEVALKPSLGLRELSQKLIQGQPAIFVTGTDGDPYVTLANTLQIDPAPQLIVDLNGNDWLAFEGTRSGERVFTHVSDTPEGKAALRRHRRGLRTANSVLAGTPLLSLIAHPIHFRQSNEICFFTQSYMPGEKVIGRNLSEDDFAAKLKTTSDPLVTIHEATYRQEAPDQALLRRMRRDASRLGLSPSMITKVEQMLDDVALWLNSRRPGSVYAHGDYSISNVLFDKSGGVSAILDWEWTRRGACAGFDAVHLGIRASAARSGTDIPSFAAAVVRSRKIPSATRAYFEVILRRLGLRDADLIPLAKLVWLYVIFRTGIWTSPTYSDWLTKSVQPMLGPSNEENAVC